eukprot:g1019.t1
MIGVLLLTIALHFALVLATFPRISVAQNLSAEVLAYGLSAEERNHAFHRYVAHNDVDGWTHGTSRPATQAPCIVKVPYRIDGVAYELAVNAADPKTHTIAANVQTKFNAVKGLQDALVRSISKLLRERARRCADNQLPGEFCSCLYSHMSYRNVFTQPNLIGLCPDHTTMEDFKETPPILTVEESQKVIEWAKRHRNDTGTVGGERDSVDGSPSYTYDIKGPPFHTLCEIAGVDRTEFKAKFRQNVIRLLAELPVAYKDYRLSNKSDARWFDRVFDSEDRDDVWMFVREYSPTGRFKLGWHRDACSYSLNLSLNSPEEFEGGELQLFLGSAENFQQVIVPNARARVGCGVAFGPNVLHSVKRLKKGKRWSLVVFFAKRTDDEFLPCFEF